MKALHVTGLIMVAGILCSCQAVQKKEGGTAPAVQTGFLGKEKPKVDYVTPAAFTGTSKVAIASFKIGFMEEGKAIAKAGTGFGGKSTAGLKLLGIDDALRQQVTDVMYDDFVQQLRNGGYEVVDRQELVESEPFRKVKDYEAPYRKKSSMFGSGNEMTYFTPSSFGGRMYIMPSDNLGMGGLGFSNPLMASCEFAEKNGEIRVLYVTYVVDFANAEMRGGRWSTYSGVKIGQGLSVRTGSQLGIAGGHGGTFSKKNGSAALGQPCFTTEEFGEVVDVTSGAYKTVQVATNLLSAVTGGGTNQTREFEIKADPEKYRRLCQQVIAEANQQLVDAAVAKR